MTRKKRRGHGEGTLSRRKDGRWVGIVDIGWQNGKRARKYVYGRTRAEALAKLKDAQRLADQGIVIAGERTTVEELLTSWLDSVRATLRPGTWKRYEQYVRVHAVPVIGWVRLTKLGPEHLQRLYAHRLAAGSSKQTVLHLHRTPHRALHQALRWGLVARNVATLVDPPRVERVEYVSLWRFKLGG